MTYRIRIRLGDESETVGYSSQGRMVTEASEYAEQGYIVSYLSQG